MHDQPSDSHQCYQNASKSAAHASLLANLAKVAAEAQPTPFHQLLRTLEISGILGRVYTQNIDDLELKAGLTILGDEPSCVQLHGSAMKVQCTQCSFTEHVYHHYSALRDGRLPACPKCETWIKQRRSQGKRVASTGGLLRPAIILYGESHSNGDNIGVMQDLDCSKVDNILVVGTSLKTFGSLQLIREMSAALRTSGVGKVFYMNLDAPTTSQEKLFDYILQADCQDFATLMLRELGTPKRETSLGAFGGQADVADWVNEGTERNDMRPSWHWV